MTIARRLLVLLSIPLVILVALGVISWWQLREIRAYSSLVAEKQVKSLATVGHISRSMVELRTDMRSFLLAHDAAGRTRALNDFEASRAALETLLAKYADNFISDDQDRRLLGDYTDLCREWNSSAAKIMAVHDAGKHEEAVAMMDGPFYVLGQRLNSVSSEWIGHNEQVATREGDASIVAIDSARRQMVIAVCAALILSGAFGVFTYRRIINPIRALQSSVEAIAAGNYASEVPFTKAVDETGQLARSISVLKRGAEGLEDQRWVKSSSAKLLDLQNAGSLKEFGQRFLAGLMPLIGGGAAAIYFADESETLRLAAVYATTGQQSAPEIVGPGEGLAGQCARDRRRLSVTAPPAHYLRISSALGEAVPGEVVALPVVSQGKLLAVIEIATFAPLRSRENAALSTSCFPRRR